MASSPTRGFGTGHRLGAARARVLSELRDCAGIWAGDLHALAEFAVQQLFYELDALEVEQLHVAIEATIERHADLPRPREDFRVGDRRLVHQYVDTGRRVALLHLQPQAVEIAGA